jgi:fatty acid-binding protein DegV
MAQGDSALRPFAVVTDSTADIAPAHAARLGISVVPLTVTIGDHTYADAELSQEEFFARMNSTPGLPTTSQPSVGAFV